MPIKVTFADPPVVATPTQPPLPTLGDIIDKLARERPDVVLRVDPAWRTRQVSKLEIVTR